MKSETKEFVSKTICLCKDSKFFEDYVFIVEEEVKKKKKKKQIKEMNSTAFKASGMTYLKYLNLCSQHVRNSLKEPWRTQALLKSKVNV